MFFKRKTLNLKFIFMIFVSRFFRKILLSAHGDGMIYGHDVKTQKQVLQTPQISEGSGGHTDSANG